MPSGAFSGALGRRGGAEGLGNGGAGGVTGRGDGGATGRGTGGGATEGCGTGGVGRGIGGAGGGGGATERGKGGASMKMTGSLRALPDGGTEVISVSEVSVVGILAQVGSRMIHEVSNVMFQQFVVNFQEQLKAIPNPMSLGAAAVTGPPPPVPKPINAFSLALSALWAAIKGLFRHSSK